MESILESIRADWETFPKSCAAFRFYNYTQDGLRRPSFTVGVAYHDEPAQVIALLEQAIGKTDGVIAGDYLPKG